MPRRLIEDHAMNAITKPASADTLADAIREAQRTAYINADWPATPSSNLIDALAKRGLVIIEASKYDTLLTTMQVIGSYRGPKHITDVAVAALKKIGSRL
jgi:hypothetical protein